MAKITETLMTKEQIGRKDIAEFSSAMKYHKDDLQTTIKLMRSKLEQIQQRESAAAVIKKPPTVRKIVFKFGGSITSVLHKRPHSQTLVSDSRNAGPSHSKTLINCKRQKINNSNTGGMQLTDINSTTVSQQNPNVTETMINNNNINGGVINVMDFIKSMGGSEAELMIEKRLTSSDVTDNQGRLLIPALKVNNQGFLTKDEKIILGKKQEVCVFDPKRRKSTLNLVKWKMSKEYYVLKLIGTML